MHLHRDPDASEFLIQAASVIAAGSKGIMYFQTIVETNATYPETWEALANFNTDVGAIREYLREGDVINGVESSDGFEFTSNSSVSAIRSSQAIIVVLISFANAGGYSDELCWAGLDVHWKTLDHTIDWIRVTIPSDFGHVVDAFEVLDGSIIPVTGDLTIASKLVTVTNVDIPTSVSKRIFVLANTPEVRQTLQNNLSNLGVRRRR